jgi:ankyrin repeat protein
LDSIANPKTESAGGRAVRDPAVMLHRALIHRDDAKETPEELKVVELLLAAGADVKLANPGGITPLHWAAITTNAVVVVILLDAGAE